MFGVVAGSWFFLVDLELAVPLPLPPARCQTPGVSSIRRWEGRAGASTSSLLLATGFVPLARRGAQTFLRSRPSLTWAGVSDVVAVLLSHGKCPLREPNFCRPRCWGGISFLQVV